MNPLREFLFGKGVKYLFLTISMVFLLSTQPHHALAVATTTVADGTNPASLIVSASSTATSTDSFTFQTTSATDTITAIILNISNASSTSKVEITNDAGTIVYGSTTNPTGASTTSITLNNATLTASTTLIQYKVRITPKTHATLPSATSSRMYPVYTTVNSWTGTNAKIVNDATSATTNIDNEPPASTGGSGQVWTSRTSLNNNSWNAVTFGNQLFVAVSATTTTANSVMSSPDGITWTARTSATANQWKDITFGNNIFVAVSATTTSNKSVMTSPDGITWTIRTATTTNNPWSSVTFGSGLFVAVSATSTKNNVMTSPDGITWTARTGAAQGQWNDITYGNGMFVAVSATTTSNKSVMTSVDGINWTLQSATTTNNAWASVTYAEGLFIAVSTSTNATNVMTSSDGITWTGQTGATTNAWTSIDYGNGLYTAVANTGTGNRIMTSPDGITWTSQTNPVDNNWSSIVYANGVFVAVANSGTANRVMTSSSTLPSVTKGDTTATISFLTPGDSDLGSFLILRSTTTAVVAVPVEGTTYTAGSVIGASTVVLASTTVATSTTYSFTDTGLVNGTTYHYKVYTLDDYGNYSIGLVPSGSPVVPAGITTLGTGVDPASVTIAPGDPATSTDAFTFQTGSATDVITAVVVSLSSASSTSLLEITSDDGTIVYGSSTNPTTATTSITLNNSTLTANTTPTQYKIRITPKTQANLPIGALGALYPIVTDIVSWTGTNASKVGSDMSTSTFFIDNLSLPSFGIANASTTFTTQATSTTGTQPFSVAIGDLNNDGKLDLAVANYSSGSISIFLNNGNGTFAAKVDYTTGTWPYSVAIGDLNNDGLLDLAVANYGSNSVSVFLNTSTTTISFATKVDYTTGTSPYSVAIGDLNNDGKPDLAVANSSSTSVSIFLNTSTSTTSFATKVDYTTGTWPFSVAIGDLNNDGKPDLAVANYSSNSVSVFLNNGNGTFATNVDYTTGASPYSVAIGDLNNDGFIDLATANAASSSVSVLLNNGNGTFATNVDYTTGASPYSVAIGDLNNDGLLDLAVANYASFTVSVFLNSGSGTFTTQATTTTGTNPQSVAIGDLNNDGKNDFVVANYSSTTISIFLNNSTGTSVTLNNTQATLTFTTPPTTGATSILILRATSTITAVPVDGTTYATGTAIGASTVIMASTTFNTATTYNYTDTGLVKGFSYYYKFFVKDAYGNYSDGVTPSGSPATPVVNTTLSTGSDPSPSTIAPGSSATSTDAFTFQTDGGTDIITAVVVSLSSASSTSLLEITNDAGTVVYGSSTNPTTATTSITLNNATLTANTTPTQYKIRITPKTQANLPIGSLGALYPIVTYIQSWTGTNTNKVVSDSSTSTFVIDNQSLPSFGITNASTTFGTAVNYTTGTYPWSVAIGDFNNDGKADLAVANYTSNTVSVFLNNGNGTFATKVDYTTGSGPQSVAIGDLNNDGKADLAVANSGSNSVSVFLNNGNGTFATKGDYTTGTSPYSVAIGDLNNDGKADLAVANYTSNTVSVFLNNGNGTFATKVDYTTGTSPRSVAIGDLNNDGYADLAVANSGSNSVSVFLNNGNGTFATKGDYTTGSGPQSVAIGDLNNDGKADLAVANSGSNSVSVFLNNGNGTFATKGDYTTGTSPYSVAIGDLNNDGKPDLAVIDLSTALSIFLNNGNGTFASKISYVLGSSNQSDFVAIGDLNNDGKLDLAVTNYVAGSGTTISTFLNTSTTSISLSAGNTQVTTSYITPSSNDINSILLLRSTSVVTDIPVDGTTYATGTVIGASTVACIDSPIATSTSDSCISTSLSNGTAYHFKVFVKDNYGNYSDGIVPSNSPITPNALTTLGTGLDPSSSTIAPGSSATSTDAFTFQTDGGTDVITAVVVSLSSASSTSKIEITSDDGLTVYGSSTNPTTATTSITLNNATLTANTTPTQYKIRITPKTQANLPIGSLGALYPIVTYIQSWTGTNTNKVVSDISTSTFIIDNQSLPSFGIANASTTFATKVDYTTGTYPQSVAIGDLNNDGKPDLAVANRNSNTVSIFLNTSTSTISFATKVDYTTGTYPWSVAIGDFNNDGKADLAVANYTSNTVSVFLNNGNGTFATKVDYTTGTSPQFVAIGDLNNDGYADLAVANYGSNSVSIFLNNGNGTFATKVDYTTGTQPNSVAIGDLNNDGYIDLAVANSYNGTGGNSISTFLNNGNGTFATKVDYTTGANPWSVAIGDLNNDGKADLAVANSYNGAGGNSVSIFLNNGNGTFATKVDYTTGTNPYSVAIGDLNNDGKPDLAVANALNGAGGNSVSIFLNNGNGTFATKVDYTTGAQPNSVAIGDLNNDGKPDLAVANYISNSVSIFLNTSTSSISLTAGNSQVTTTYTTPPTNDLNTILLLRATSTITDIPLDGTTYSSGNTIGTSTVVFATTTNATSTSYTYIDTGLTNGTAYYYKFFVKDNYGNYSDGIVPSNSPITPNALTTLGTGLDPSSSTIAPGSSATSTDAFTFQTDGGTDIITAVVVSLSSASSTSLLEITNDAGTVVYGSSTNPTTATTSITLNNATLTANTTPTQYKIRITPKTQANLPIGSLGALYPIVTYIQSWTGTNTNKVASDSSTSTFVIDNQSLPSFGIANASTTFATKVDYTTGTNPISVAIGDLNNDGKADLAVANYNSNSVSIFLNTSTTTISFATKVDYTTGTQPISVAIGDLNNDGKMDLAVANYGSNSVSTFLNTSTTTISFATKVDYTTGTWPFSVAIGDLNNDGKPDLAVANYSSNSVSVFLNNGNGTFATKVDYTTGTNPYSVAIGDLNNDGYIDLAVANSYNGTGGNSVSVFLNNGNGTFATKVDYTTGTYPQSVAIGDLNNDGKPDLAVANALNGAGGNSVSIFLNNGNGTFATKVDYTTGANPWSVAIGDLNNDGKPDLAVSNYGSNSVSIFLNNGNGTFATKVDYTTGANPYSVAIGDLNNDGKPDLAVANYTSNSVSIFLNTSTSSISLTAGNTQVTTTYTTPSTNDINSILILRSTSAVVDIPVDGTTYATGTAIGASTVACIDTPIATSTSDSCISTALTNGTAYHFKVFVKDNYGNYSDGIVPSNSPIAPNSVTTLSTGLDPSPLTIAPGSSATSTDAFTFQTNGGTDIITAVVVSLSSASSTSLLEITSDDGLTVYGSSTNPTTATTSITLNNATLTANTTPTQYKIRITPKTQANLPIGSLGALYPIVTYIQSWTGTNTNKVASDSSTSTFVIDNQSLPSFGIANASTTFGTAVNYTTGASPYSVAIGDLNNDGKADLAVANYTSNTVSVFLNNGNGTFATKVDYTTGTSPRSVAIGDLNNDGYADLAVANYTSNSVSVLLNNGNGTFATKVDYTTGTNPYSVAIGDLNNDGEADLAVANYSSNSVSVFLNNGNGTFATKVDYTTGTNPYSVAIGDLNNDGKADLAVANLSSNTVSVFLNNGNGTFATKVDYTTGTNPISVAIGDLNNDGYADLVVANALNGAGGNSVSIFLNNGNGTFATKVDYTTGTNPYSVAIGDLNNDGKNDLAVANFNSASVSIFLNNGNGTFATKVDYTTGTNPISVAIGDLNNDGYADLVVANALNGAGGNSVSTFFNNSIIIFAKPSSSKVTITYTSSPPNDISSIFLLRATSTITDIPVDGTTYATGTVIGASTVVMASTTFATSITYNYTDTGLIDGTAYYYKLFVKDIYGNYSDGVVPDLSPVISGIATTSNVTTLSTGSDPSSSTIAPGSSATSTDAFTFQTDGGTDIITAVVVSLSSASSTSLLEITNDAGTVVYGSSTNPTTATTSITLNNATLTANTTPTQYKIRITPKTQANLPIGSLGALYPIVTYIQSWTGTNTNKVASDSSTSTFVIDNQSLPSFGIANASTTFATKVDYTTGTSPYSVAIGDLNNDGKPDLAVANYILGTVSVFLNNGNGTFATKVDYTTGTWPFSVAIGDLNNDGEADLAVANRNSNSVSIFLNNGNGTFATKVDYTTGAWPYSVAIGDLNNDGKADLAVANSYNGTGGNSISTFLNNGNGTFATNVDYTTGASPYSVAIGDLNNDGKPDLAVANYSSNSVSVLLNNGNGTFATKVDYTTGILPVSVAIGDLNNDGLPDLAVANRNSNSVSTFLGSGTGTFATKVDYTTGTTPYSVAIGDLNNDGKMDLAVANYISNSVSIFLNNGNGTFATKVDYTTGTSPYSVAIGDLNNDGKPDLAVANAFNGAGGNSVSTFLNTSTTSISLSAGNTQVTTSYITPSSNDINSILLLRSTSVVTDIPVDGTTYATGTVIGASTVACIDSPIATSTSDSCISTSLSNGTAYHFKVFVKDNYGNYSDGIVPSNSPITPNALTTLGTGLDPSSSTIAPGSSATSTDAFTFQTDGGTDVITAVVVSLSSASSTSKIEITSDDGLTVYGSSTNPTTATTSITLNNATLTANTTPTQYKIRITPKTQANLPIGSLGALYPIVTYIQSWTGTNTNKVASDSSTSTFVIDNQSLPSFGIANASTTFATKVDYTTGTNPISVAIGDLNNDGKMDLAVANSSSTSVSIFLNTSTSTISFATKVDYTTGTWPFSVAIGDLNNDGKADLAVANYTSNTVSVFLNNGNGTFATKVDYTTGTQPNSVAIGDLNNDGKPDLAVANSYNGVGGNSISTFLNNGNGTFATKVDYTTGTQPNSVAIGDLNNDGYIDLAVANSYNGTGGNSISTFLNNGNGTFATKVDYTTGANPWSVAIGDFNNDGKADLAVANYTSNTVSVFLNNGNGTFATKVDYTTGTTPYSVAIGDLNNDGYIDLAVANSYNGTGGNSVSTFLNTSTSTFSLASKVDYTTGTGLTSVAIGDLNNDGKADLVTANQTANSISTFLNTSTSSISLTAGNSQVTTTYTTPPTNDLNTILLLRATSTITDIPLDGTTYSSGNTIGTSTVVFATTTNATSTSYTYIDTGLTNGTAYYYKFFVKDNYGNYSDGIVPSNSPITPNALTTLGTGLDPSSSTIAPGSSATSTDAFTFQTNGGTDIITAVVVSLSSASSTSLLEITSDDGLTVYGSSTNPTTATTSITLNNATLTANTTPTQYKIRITPKTQANLPIGSLGALYPIVTYIQSWTGTNTNKVASDSSTSTFVIDNQSLPSFGITNTSTTFATKVDYTTGTAPYSVAIGDLNNDGKMDLAVANSVSNSVSVFLNTSTSTTSFATKVDYTTGASPYSVAIGDLNNDGLLDLAVANYSSNSVSIFLNTSTTTISFATKVDYTTGTSPQFVAIGDLNNDGKPDLAVANYTSNSVSVFLNNGNGTFATKVDYTTGTYPQSVAIGDLNNDGKPDLAVANALNGAGGNSVSIFLNNGNGTFATKVDYTTGANPYSVAIGDLNNDGKPDLAVSNYGSNSVSTLLNNGNGTFATKVDYTTGTWPYSVAIGDLNNDGKPDLAVANYISNSVSIFLNNGNGTFATKVDYTTGTSPRSVAIGDLNNDGKPDLAVANYGSNSVSTFLNTSTSSISLTAGNTQVTTTYTTPSTNDINSILILRSTSAVVDIPVDGTTYATGTAIGASTVACIDSPIATSTSDSCISTSLSNGTAYHFKVFVKDNYGNYSDGIVPSNSPITPNALTTLGTGLDPSSSTIAPGSSATSTDAFTFQTDGGTDVITAVVVSLSSASSTSKIEITSDDGLTVYGSSTNPTTATTSITLNNATLTANTTPTQYKIRITPKTQANLPIGSLGALYPIVTYIQSWTGTNTNKVASDSSTSTFVIDNQSLPSFGITNTSTTFATKVDYTTGTAPYSVAIGDLNNDGKMDLAVANSVSNSVSVFLNTSTSTTSFATKVDYTTGASPYSVAIGDLNNDGKMDLAVANYILGTVSVFLNNGNGTFATKVDYTTGSGPQSVAIGDLNNDGKMDLAVANYILGTVSVFLNNGNGTFATKVDYTTGSGPQSVAIGDLNNDGKMDLAVANYSSSTVSVFLNNGNGTFATKVDYTTGSGPQSVAIGDLNNDGKMDLAVANYSSSTVSVFLNNGNGTFATKVDYTTGTSPYSVAIGDLNNDGKPDLAVANYILGTVSVFLNNGNGTFATKVDYTTGTWPFSVAIGDLNNDGKPDLAVANRNSNSVSIFLNTSTSSISLTAGNTQVTTTYTTPSTNDINSILLLRSFSAVVDIPVDGTTYATGTVIGASTVVMATTTNATSTSYTYIDTGLTNGIAYYYKFFVKDNYGNYSDGIVPSGSPARPSSILVTLASGTDPVSVTIAPGSSATSTDAFTFQTSTSTDTVTSVNIAITNASSTSLLEITSDDGLTVYGSTSTPTGTSVYIPLSPSITVSTTSTQYKIRITPKTQSNLPYGSLGVLYNIVTNITSWTSSNLQVGSDIDTGTTTIDNLPPSSASGTPVLAPGNNLATLSYTTPSDADLSNMLILRSSGAIVDVPVDGTTYATGTVIGASTVVFSTSTTATSTAFTYTDTGLTNAVAYHYKLFAKDSNGNYSIGVIPTGSPVTPNLSTTLGNGTDTPSVTIAPGSLATTSDSFTFKTDIAIDNLSALTVAMTNASSTSLLEITSDDGITVYGSTTNPTGSSVSVNLTPNITASTTLVQYHIRITPKTQANLPIGSLGLLYPVTTTISGWTGGNTTKAILDTSSPTITIDNEPPSSASGTPTVTGGTAQATVSFITASSSDLRSVLILRATAPITDIPVDGTTYSAGNTIGISTIVLASTTVATSTTYTFTDTGLTNGTGYYYKVFSSDTYGNYSGGVVATGSPVTPGSASLQVQVSSYRFRKDDGSESGATYSLTENTSLTSNFIVGDASRIRFAVSNQGSATSTATFALEYATSTCTTWTTVPRFIDATYQHFKIDISPYVADGQSTTHSSGISIPNGKTFTAGTIQTFNASTQAITLGPTQYTELEYLIRSTSKIVPYAVYCFRLSNLGDTTGFTYPYVPQVMSYAKEFRYQGGGGIGSSGNGFIILEAPSAVGTTTVIGGGNAGGSASTTDATSTPHAGQSTTTPQQGGGSGGDVGFFNGSGSGFAFNQSNAPVGNQNSSHGMVLGASASTMCVDMKHTMAHGSTDKKTRGEVSELQYYLRLRGYFFGSITGTFGNVTGKSVKQFQRDNGISASGIVDQTTRDKMKELGCVKQ